MQTQIENYKQIINNKLDEYLTVKFPEKLWESMRYSTLSGGKRIRAILMLEVAKACGGNIENVLPTACALEMLHAQSLIHDDLPCMDDDDLRRGKPTNHKVYGEGMAVLAGDALISYGIQVIIQNTPEKMQKDILLKVLEEYSLAAGAFGIVGGQVVDIDSENKQIDMKTFEYIHKHKTGKLFEFAIRAGALLSNISSGKIAVLTEFAESLGFAFQIADDILDIIGTKETLGKTPGKDQKTNKNTHPSIFGLENSMKELEGLCLKAENLLTANDLSTPLLIDITREIYLKVKNK